MSFKPYQGLLALSTLKHTSGRWRDDRISGAAAKVMFMAITTEEGAERPTDLIAPLLATHHLLVLVSNVEALRAPRFC